MNDSYKEILVKKDTPVILKLLKVLLYALTAVCIVLGMAGAILFLAVGIVLLAVDLLAVPRFDVEYEYLYVNGGLDIDAIYSRQKRKKAASFEIEDLEIAASENSHALDHFRADKNLKLKDYSSGKSQGKCYIMVFSKDKKREMIKVEIDDEIVQDIRRRAPRKVDLS